MTEVTTTAAAAAAWCQEEANAWEEAAAAVDDDGGLILQSVNLNSETEMNQVYEALNITKIGPKSRLRAYIRRLQTQHEEQQRDNLSDKLTPLFNVLPDLLREVNLTRKSRLNCWERESARTTGSKRDGKFRKKVIAFYDRASKSRKTVKCQILDELTPITEAEDKIIAAHIWKASTRGKGLEEFGLLPKEINNARNGMFLTKGIEDAFDKQQVCFLYNVLESSLILWVADHAILSATIIGSTKKFSDVHQKPLLCPHGRLPYRRLLSWHARLTLELRKETLLGLNCTSEYDNSPGREHAKRDPIAQAIDSMVEPGDDASV
jgi:hypothetical protein